MAQRTPPELKLQQTITHAAKSLLTAEQAAIQLKDNALASELLSIRRALYQLAEEATAVPETAQLPQ